MVCFILPRFTMKVSSPQKHTNSLFFQRIRRPSRNGYGLPTCDRSLAGTRKLISVRKFFSDDGLLGSQSLVFQKHREKLSRRAYVEAAKAMFYMAGTDETPLLATS